MIGKKLIGHDTQSRSVRILLAVAVAFFISGRFALAQQQTQQRIIDDFASAVEAGVKADGGGCVMVAVFKGDEVIWSKGFGLADVENKVTATANTIARTGSISKSFTAVLICQLAEQGVLKLDDPVQKHFPEIKKLSNPPANSKPITYRMLASHTAGLAREPKNARVTARGRIKLWEKKILESIPETAFKTKPLTEYSYSNIGYGILGLAGSRAAEKPFISLVEKLIFDPLAMKSSTFVVDSEELKKRLAVGYLRNRATGKLSSEVPTRQHAGRGYKVPNGGIYSTVGDMAKFAAAMMGETRTEILTAKSRQQMFTPQKPAEVYGLGFRIQRYDGLKIVGHSGAVAGYRADLRFDLDSKWGVASLATTQFTPPSPKLLVDLVNASGAVVGVVHCAALPLHTNSYFNQERDPMKDIPGIDEDGNPKNGPFKLFFKNGFISCQGEFDNGKKSGKWKYFLNNGQMQSSGSFKGGKIVGRWKWFYKTGEPRAMGGFDDEEQKHGAWKRYHPNGQLWDEGRFEHGKKRGTWKVYDEAGELLKTQTFK